MARAPARRKVAQKNAKKPTDQPETIELGHSRAANMPYVFADGALVRGGSGNMIMTFYTDETIVQSQAAKLKGTDPKIATYELGAMTESRGRVEHAVVRLPIVSAVSLAALIFQKAQELGVDQTKIDPALSK